MKNLFILLLLSGLFSAAAQQSFINVTGTSEITKKADQLKFTVRINTVAKTVEDSKKTNDRLLVDLLIILKGAGIPSDETEISPISFGKNYDQTSAGKRANGYYALVNVSFLLRDLTRYYDITNKLSSTDGFEIAAEHTISDYEIQHRSCYEKALDDAKEKGKYMAAAMGVRLGDVLEIEEGSGEMMHYPNPLNTATVISDETKSSAGIVTIRRTVRVKFAIAGR